MSKSSNESKIQACLTDAKKLIQSAKFDEAIKRLNPCIEEGMDAYLEGEVLYTQAVASRYKKDHLGALHILDKLHSKLPLHARAYQEKAYNFYAQADLASSIENFKRALELNPALLAAWKNLALLYSQSGKKREAMFAQAQAEYLQNLPQPLLNAKDLFHDGKLFKAEQLCRQFLQQNKHHVEGMRLLAEIGMKLKVFDDAEFILESCVELYPDHLGARLDYVKVLNRKCKFEKANEQCEVLLKKQPDNPSFKISAASAFSGLGRMQEAMDLYEQCLNSNLDKAGVQVMLGHAQKAVGSIDDAVSSYQKAYHIRPSYGDAYWSLANTKTYKFSGSEIDQMKLMADDRSTPDEDRAHLCFAVGKALEDQKDFENSFHYYKIGNNLKSLRSGYSADKTEEMVDAQIKTCTEDLFSSRGNHGYQAQDPIFILGLPRAGSTLLEQILASHSQVDGTMELHNILGLAQTLRGRASEKVSNYPEILWDLDESYFRRFGEQFTENTQVYRGKAPFFIDKMPNNFMHIGLIRMILPNAKIIDARRHPMACCFSGYKQLFGEGQDFSYDQESMGRYYKDYIRLMDHWDEVLPDFVLRVQHEDVVDDLESQLRRMLDFCGLEFERSCLEFYKSERDVKTPSSEQVRRPISKSGVEQWKNYEPWLDPIKKALGSEVRARFNIS
ncbi:MAG: sulfotransferase [Opitutales bacterium]|nr:sulfotransferase [Opitutales bacterium]